jgi:hypothetical protein
MGEVPRLRIVTLPVFVEEVLAGGTPVLRRSIIGLFFRDVACVGERRRDYVLAAGPFAEVDQAAAITAEGKIGVSVLYGFLAGGTTQLEALGHAQLLQDGGD